MGLTTGSNDATATEPLDAVRFAACVGDLKTAAREAGVSEQVVNQVLDQVRISARVLELDRRQPEFTQTFAGYFNRRVTPARVARGREMLKTHQHLLAEILEQSGVPPQYLVAFWGLETNFGSYLGNMPIADSLATLACDDRRSRYFTGELISALKIIDAGDIDADTMRGSWAGAMGHVQFMPSAYLRHAVDQDGDGRRDLFGSEADSLASAGHFLAALGWEPGLRWGREVVLPADFDYRSTGKTMLLEQWHNLGITDAFGRALPAVPISAVLRLPAGHPGPAFLTYRNFDVIMGWNRSVFYALAVGHLADRIAGAGTLRVPPPEDDLRFSTEELMAIQLRLRELGYQPGEADGRLGPATRAAVQAFQSDNGLISDGHLNADIVRRIEKATAPAG